MKYLTKYAYNYDIERERTESTKKTFNFRKKTKTVDINYEEVLKKYLDGSMSREEIQKLFFNKIAPKYPVSDELLIDFFIKYYDIKPISINELDSAIEIIGHTIQILENNLELLNEYGIDVKKNEKEIRKIYSDNDKNLSDNIKNYVGRYYVAKVKSIESSLNLHINMFNTLNELKRRITENDFKDIHKLMIEFVEDKESAPFSDFYFIRLKKYLNIHKKISKLIINNERIKRLHELANAKIFCLDCSDKFNSEYESLKGINEKRESHELEVYINNDVNDQINNEIICILDDKRKNSSDFHKKLINNINLIDPILFYKYIKKVNRLNDISEKNTEIIISSIEKFLIIIEEKINLLISYKGRESENFDDIKSVYVPGEISLSNYTISNPERNLKWKLSKLNKLKNLYKNVIEILKSYISFIQKGDTKIFDIDFSKVYVNFNPLISYIKNIEKTISKYREYYNIFMEEDKNKKFQHELLYSNKSESLTEEEVLEILNKEEIKQKNTDEETIKNVIESIDDYVNDKNTKGKMTIINYLKDYSEFIDSDLYTKALCKYYNIQSYEEDELDKLIYTLEYFINCLVEKQKLLIKYGKDISNNEIKIRCVYVEGDENYSLSTKNNINRYYKTKLKRLKNQIEELQNMILKISKFKELLGNNYSNLESLNFKQVKIDLDFLNEYINEFKNILRAFNLVLYNTSSDKKLKLVSLSEHIIKG